MNFDAMCRAGAAGRITLIKAAAEMLGVPESELYARESHVHHAKSKKSLSYAQIVAGGKANKAWTADELKAIKLKTRDQYTKIGQSLRQLDIPAKTNGTAKYGIDAFAPDMLYGKLALPPVRYGATVKSVDDSEAKKVPGFVKAVVVEDKTATTSGWVVAVANSYEGAKKAAAALKIDWDKGKYANVSDQSIIDESRRLQKDGTEGLLFVKDGDSAAAHAKAAKVIDVEYLTSINIHCPLEPMNALALEKDGVWHIYTGNQFFTRTTIIAVRGGRYRSQEYRAPSALPGRRLRTPAGIGHGGTGDRRGQGRRQAGEADLCPRRRHADGFHPALDLPEGQSRARRRWQGDRHGARRDRRVADREMGHPGLPHPGRGQERVGDSSKACSTASLSTAPTTGTRSPTTRCATSRTSWRRARRLPANCARSRPPGRSGRSKAPWTRSPTPTARTRWRCGSSCLTAPAPMPAATSRRPWAAPSVSPTRCALRWAAPATERSSSVRMKGWASPASARRNAQVPRGRLALPT